MAVLVTAIHGLVSAVGAARNVARSPWMTGTRPVMTSGGKLMSPASMIKRHQRPSAPFTPSGDTRTGQPWHKAGHDDLGLSARKVGGMQPHPHFE
jgi:hypothetical protein